tara:strand:- start:10 stop:471 length:462 start_codon:yes stop_codon:yes gene_type:complete
MNKETVLLKSGLIALQFSFTGLIIAYLIMVIISSDIFWISDLGYIGNIVLGAISMLLCSFFIGKLSGFLIKLKKWNFILSGVLTGFLVLWSGSFIGSLIGLFQEGLFNSYNSTPFFDYIFKPFYWITTFGFLPIVILGPLYGWRIKKLPLTQG